MSTLWGVKLFSNLPYWKTLWESEATLHPRQFLSSKFRLWVTEFYNSSFDIFRVQLKTGEWLTLGLSDSHPYYELLLGLILHRVSYIWSSDIWSFWLYFGYMVNGQSDFSTKFFGYMVISAIWSTLSGQNRGPYIRNPVPFHVSVIGCITDSPAIT